MTQFIEFTFTHAAISADDNVKVINFTGNEGISKPYEFLIELKSDNADLDIDAILDTQASFTIAFGDDSRLIQGLISQFDAIKQVNNHTIYRAKLVPKLWELSLYHTNEIYLDKTVPEIIEIVLKEAGLTGVDYDISGLQGEYRKWPYKCQYSETHLDFISRLLERDGIYYYFSEGDVGEKIIFCDHLLDQDAIALPDVLYSPVSSMEINTLGNTVHSFISQQKRVPYKVLVKDYNDDSPTVDIKGEAIIDPDANQHSEVYVWGQNIESTEEGQQLATVRAEEIRAGKKTYHGESSVIRLLSGFNFTLKEHFRQSCNQEYLLLTLSHEGSDPSALNFSDDNSQQQRVYVNQFSAISSSVQFRPVQVTPRPEIHGTLNAFIDAEGDGEYAELDEEGRYRVTMPFDRVNRDGGKSSHWLRMSQPFAGANAGMSFPMRKGGEVLLTFIGGDPDRPVIAGSIPNAAQPSITNSDNQTNSLIQTAAGNKIEIEDKNGKNRIKLQTGDNKTYMHLGSPNHDGDGFVLITDGIERKFINGGQRLTVSANGAEGDAELSTSSTTDIITKAEFDDFDHKFTVKNESGVGSTEMSETQELSGNYLIERRTGDKYLWTDGQEYIYGGGNVFEFGNGYTEIHNGDDIMGEWTFPESISGAVTDGYAPGDNLVEKIWANTISYQCGNNYAWGDTCDYNFGNGYEENIVEGTTINANHEEDKAGSGGPGFGTITGSLVSLSEDTTCVSKMIGNSYDYRKGDALEVVKGNSESHTYGDSHDEVHGHSIEHVRGSSHSTHHGATNDMFMGASSEFMLGAASSMALSATSDMQIGASNSMFLGLKTDFCISAGFEMAVGPMTELYAGPDIGVKVTSLEAAMANIGTALSNLSTSVNQVNSSISKVDNRVNNLGVAVFKIATGGLQMNA
jgi:type VI secretion system secreted protein VgrG